MTENPTPKSVGRRAYSKWYYETHKKKCHAATAKWWNNHRDKLRDKWNRKRIKYREVLNKKQLDYRHRNIHACRKRNSKWQSDNWEYRQQYMREYYAKNREKIKSKMRDYHKKNPAVAWIAAQKRRSLMEQSASNLELLKSFVTRIKSKTWCYCYWCEKRIRSSKAHFDHMIPISKGGQHCIENLCVSCSPCNLSKHNSTSNKWNKHPQILLSL